MWKARPAVPSALLGCAVLALAAACGGDSSQAGGDGGNGGDSVTIAMIQPLTGTSGYYGGRIRQGAQLAADEINAAGGILGKQVRITVEDGQSDKTQTVSLFRKLASDRDVPVIVGPTDSSSYLAAAPLAKSLKVAWFSAGSGAPWPEGLPNSFTYRNTVPFSTMVTSHLKNVLPKLDVDAVASIYSPDNAGVAGPQQIGSAALKELGIRESVVVEARSGTTDFGPQITRLAAENPKVILVNLTTADASLFMRQARGRGLQAQFVAGHNGLLDLKVLELSQGAAEGLIVPSHFSADTSNAEIKRFMDAWTKKNGNLDDYLVTYGWDALYIIKKAMEDADTTSDRTAVADAIGKIKDLCLASGCYTYDGPGDRIGADVYPIVMGKDSFQKWEP